MSQDIINEVYFFAVSILMGILITFAYDFILILRRIVRHSLFFISLEDFIFWAACAITVFYMLYKENNGILRWFAVLGAAFGMLLYKKIVGKHFVNIISVIIQKEIHIIVKVMGIVLKPLRWMIKKVDNFFRFLFHTERKFSRHMKKKLTGFTKMLKMVLSKH